MINTAGMTIYKQTRHFSLKIFKTQYFPWGYEIVAIFPRSSKFSEFF